MPTITAHQELPKAAAAEPAKPVEQAPTEPAVSKEEPKQPEKLSPQFAALARKEKGLRLEAQKIKLEREAIKAEREKLNTSEYIPKSRLNTEFMKVLSEAGISSDQAASFLLNQQSQSPDDPRIAKLEAKIAELEGKTTKVETDFKDNQSKAYDHAVNQIRSKVKILVDSDPAYETIKSEDRSEDVVKHIQKTFEEEGIVLSEQEAAKEVEDELVEIALRLASVGKIKSRLQPKEEASVTPPQTAMKLGQQKAVTLTHDMTSASIKPKLSARDRYQRAVLRASGLDPDTGKPFGAA